MSCAAQYQVCRSCYLYVTGCNKRFCTNSTVWIQKSWTMIFIHESCSAINAVHLIFDLACITGGNFWSHEHLIWKRESNNFIMNVHCRKTNFQKVLRSCRHLKRRITLERASQIKLGIAGWHTCISAVSKLIQDFSVCLNWIWSYQLMMNNTKSKSWWRPLGTLQQSPILDSKLTTETCRDQTQC